MLRGRPQIHADLRVRSLRASRRHNDPLVGRNACVAGPDRDDPRYVAKPVIPMPRVAIAKGLIMRFSDVVVIEMEGSVVGWSPCDRITFPTTGFAETAKQQSNAPVGPLGADPSLRLPAAKKTRRLR